MSDALVGSATANLLTSRSASTATLRLGTHRLVRLWNPLQSSSLQFVLVHSASLGRWSVPLTSLISALAAAGAPMGLESMFLSLMDSHAAAKQTVFRLQRRDEVQGLSQLPTLRLRWAPRPGSCKWHANEVSD